MTTMVISKYKTAKTYVTKDGSTIRELMHPEHHQVKNQSLAEAVVSPGTSTLRHKHLQSEEIYHIIGGRGRMSLDEEIFEVSEGDTIVIHPGVLHHLINDGTNDLRILCCCSPPYSHQDTALV